MKTTLNYDHLSFLSEVTEAVRQATEDHHEAAYWKKEAEHWRTEFNELLNSSVKHSDAHSDAMMGNMLSVLIKGSPK